MSIHKSFTSVTYDDAGELENAINEFLKNKTNVKIGTKEFDLTLGEEEVTGFVFSINCNNSGDGRTRTYVKVLDIKDYINNLEEYDNQITTLSNNPQARIAQLSHWVGGENPKKTVLTFVAYEETKVNHKKISGLCEDEEKLIDLLQKRNYSVSELIHEFKGILTTNRLKTLIKSINNKNHLKRENDPKQSRLEIMIEGSNVMLHQTTEQTYAQLPKPLSQEQMSPEVANYIMKILDKKVLTIRELTKEDTVSEINQRIKETNMFLKMLGKTTFRDNNNIYLCENFLTKDKQPKINSLKTQGILTEKEATDLTLLVNNQIIPYNLIRNAQSFNNSIKRMEELFPNMIVRRIKGQGWVVKQLDLEFKKEKSIGERIQSTKRLSKIEKDVFKELLETGRVSTGKIHSKAIKLLKKTFPELTDKIQKHNYYEFRPIGDYNIIHPQTIENVIGFIDKESKNIMCAFGSGLITLTELTSFVPEHVPDKTRYVRNLIKRINDFGKKKQLGIIIQDVKKKGYKLNLNKRENNSTTELDTYFINECRTLLDHLKGETQDIFAYLMAKRGTLVPHKEIKEFKYKSLNYPESIYGDERWKAINKQAEKLELTIRVQKKRGLILTQESIK